MRAAIVERNSMFKSVLHLTQGQMIVSYVIADSMVRKSFSLFVWPRASPTSPPPCAADVADVAAGATMLPPAPPRRDVVAGAADVAAGAAASASASSTMGATAPPVAELFGRKETDNLDYAVAKKEA